jgi:hypothetical protein
MRIIAKAWTRSYPRKTAGCLTLPCSFLALFLGSILLFPLKPVALTETEAETGTEITGGKIKLKLKLELTVELKLRLKLSANVQN